MQLGGVFGFWDFFWFPFQFPVAAAVSNSAKKNYFSFIQSSGFPRSEIKAIKRKFKFDLKQN